MSSKDPNQKPHLSILEAATALGIPIADVKTLCDAGAIDHGRNELGHHQLDARQVAALAKNGKAPAMVEGARAKMEKRPLLGFGPANPAPAEPDPGHLG